MSDLTKEELDDIFYQGGPLEEEWEESDYDEAIRRVHDESIAAATPHIRAALFDELIADAGGEEHSPIMYYKTNGQGAFMGATTVGNWLTEQKNKENTQP